MANEFFQFDSNEIISPALQFDPAWQLLSSSSMNIEAPWENLTEQSINFDSPFSSIVSSNNSNVSNESFQMKEFMRKLLDNGDPSFMDISGDPGLVQRAAAFSCFGYRSFNGRTEVKRGFLEKCSDIEMRYVSDEFFNPPEEYQLSKENPDGEGGLNSLNRMNPRKRKAVSKGKVKEAAIFPSAKHVKVGGDIDSGKKQSKPIQDHENEKNCTINSEEEQTKTSTKSPDPLKDYIHVRARRGQATDSHSLAERVRREKIGERMKLLQDLVPGCNKVTGKAVMLDEIINYVQSLQRQVEFLSMKLASVNFGPKDVQIESRGSKTHLLNDSFQDDQKIILRSDECNETANVLDSVQYQNHGMQLPPLDELIQCFPQFESLSEGDLHSLVQMGLARF